MNRPKARDFPLDPLISGPLPEHAILSEGGFSPAHSVLSTYHSPSLRGNRSRPWLIPPPVNLTGKFNRHANPYYYNKKAMHRRKAHTILLTIYLLCLS